MELLEGSKRYNKVFYTENGRIYRRCGKCKEILPLTNFHRKKRTRYNIGGYCKACNSDYLHNYSSTIKGRDIKQKSNSQYWSQYYQENRESILKYRKGKYNPVKLYANNAVYRALKSGKLIKPDFCSKCGESWSKIQAHHEDYHKRLEIIWLCISCHKRHHNKEGNSARI